MPQHADANFFLRAVGDGVADQICDGTGAAVFLQLRRKLHAFGHDHDREMLTDFFAFSDVAADVLDGEWDFRNEDHMRSAGDSGFERDPTTVAAHHFDHHHAMM